MNDLYHDQIKQSVNKLKNDYYENIRKFLSGYSIGFLKTLLNRNIHDDIYMDTEYVAEQIVEERMKHAEINSSSFEESINLIRETFIKYNKNLTPNDILIKTNIDNYIYVDISVKNSVGLLEYHRYERIDLFSLLENIKTRFENK